MSGGSAGGLGKNTLIRKNGEEIDLGSRAEISVDIGDRVRVETPGGGGWGKEK